MTTNGSAREREVLEDRLLDAFERFMHRLALSHGPEFAELGLTMAQAKVLYLVHGAGTLRMSELASRLGVTISTTSAQVDRLAALGLLTRRDDPADRRHVLLATTDVGAKRLERMRELNVEQMRRMVARLADDELETVAAAIELLAAAIDPPLADPPVVPSRKEAR